METSFEEPARNKSKMHSSFAPLSLLLLALLVWVGFQTTQLLSEGEKLKAMEASQEVQLQQSKKLRAALDALAADTAKLAEQGNPNAKLLVEELRKRGVTINPNAAKPVGSDLSK